jgi:hypothetical protein
MRLKTPPAYIKLAFMLLVACIFSCVSPASITYAKKKLARYGTLKVQTTPLGLPVEVDGKPEDASTTEGRIWNLNPGRHLIVINLPDGQRWTREINLEAGRIKCVGLNYKPGLPPVPNSPCPYPVNLSAPASVSDGDVITYTSDVTYGGSSALNYTWTVSPANARILSGLGTRTITVDSTGLANQTITATLVVDDGSGDAACRQSSQASTWIPAAPRRENPARQFDVCCSCAFDDQKARLDNLAVQLQNDPSSAAHIIAYAGRNSRRGEANRLGTRARDYLVTTRGINSSQITVVNGGFREEDCVELWIVPSGAIPPQPTPTVQAGDVNPGREPTTRRHRRN